MPAPGYATIDLALEEIANGRPVIVTDNPGRENEGDIIMAGEHANAAWLGFTIRYSSGIVCTALTGEQADRLDLPPMVACNQDPRGTAYTVTVDAAEGISTGVSAADRARTISILASEQSQPGDLNRPGHILPLRARPGGVLERAGHTEAAIDLCRFAGCQPSGLLAEIMRDDGDMMRVPELLFFARTHRLLVIAIDDLIEWRLCHDAAEPAPAAIAM